MRMQEPEQQPVYDQEWQANQEYGGYHAESVERNELADQKVYPQEEQSRLAALPWISMIVFSSSGVFFTVAGIVGSAIALQYAHGQQTVIAGGVIALVSSILAMLACIAIFVISVVTLSLRARKGQWRARARRRTMP